MVHEKTTAVITSFSNLNLVKKYTNILLLYKVRTSCEQYRIGSGDVDYYRTQNWTQVVKQIELSEDKAKTSLYFPSILLSPRKKFVEYLDIFLYL